MHKKKSFFLLVLLLSYSTLWAQLCVITIENKLALPFTGQLIEIPWQQFQELLSGVGNNTFKIINAATKQDLPWQLEYKGEKNIQNLLVQVSVSAKASLMLWVIKGSPKKFAAQPNVSDFKKTLTRSVKLP